MIPFLFPHVIHPFFNILIINCGAVSNVLVVDPLLIVLSSMLLQVSQVMGIEAPIPFSAKLGNFNDVFCRIINAAQHPHLSIPVTEAGKNRKHYLMLVKNSLVFVSGMPFLCLILMCHFPLFCLQLSSGRLVFRYLYYEMLVRTNYPLVDLIP